MNKPQIITGPDGRPAYAVIPWDEYNRLTGDAHKTDEELFQEAQASDDGDRIPYEEVKRMLDGESPVRVFREHRGMSQEALAEAAGIAQAYLSQIESGKRTGSAKVLARLAQALRVDLDDLV